MKLTFGSQHHLARALEDTAGHSRPGTPEPLIRRKIRLCFSLLNSLSRCGIDPDHHFACCMTAHNLRIGLERVLKLVYRVHAWVKMS